MARLIAVAGASGELGSRVAHRLADRGAEQRLIVRDAGRAPRLGANVVTVPGGYADAQGLCEALRGTDTLLLVPAAEAADRVEQHLTAVKAAEQAGVERIVYVSFQGAAPEATFTLARDHAATEAAIRETGRPHCLPRMSLYMDFLPEFVQDGVIRGPAGDGRVAAVLRDDLADVLVELLLDDAHDGAPFDVTGPEALSLDEVAEQLTAAGTPTRYERETRQEALDSRAASAAEAWEVTGWVSSYEAIAAGEMATVTDAVARIAGHAPRTLADWLQEA